MPLKSPWVAGNFSLQDWVLQTQEGLSDGTDLVSDFKLNENQHVWIGLKQKTNRIYWFLWFYCLKTINLWMEHIALV